MNKKELSKLTKQGNSTRDIARKLGKSQTAVRYWLRKHKITTTYIQPLKHKCPCGETNPNNFYGHKKRICKVCHNQYTIRKGEELKQKGVDLLGGKCEICSYAKCLHALDFHHTDPKKKDPNFKGFRSWSWKRAEKELKTCVVLCKNCHAEVHAGIAFL